MADMRELKGDDLFTLLSLVGKLDIKDEFVTIFEKNNDASKLEVADNKKKAPTKAELAKKEAEAEKRGMEVMATLLQKVLLNLTKVKADINALLAELTGVTVKEIEELGLKEYTGLVIQFFKKPELKDFFSSIGSLLA